MRHMRIIRPHTEEINGESLEKINCFRRTAGLKLLEPKTRECLKCDKKFRSYSNSNRMCMACSKQEE